MDNQYRDYEGMKLISEFKEILDSGYVINTYGHIYNSKDGTQIRHKSKNKKGKQMVFYLIINGSSKEFCVRRTIKELFNVKYNEEDEEILKLSEEVSKYV